MSTLLRIPFLESTVPTRHDRQAFTLVELLMAMTVLLLMVLMMVGMTNQTNKIWRSSRARIEAFQSARNAFERVTDNLSQATLNTYLDYYNSSNQSRTDLMRAQGASSATAAAAFVPVTYDRASELQFICGQSELNSLNNGLIPPVLPAVNGSRPAHAMFFTCPIGHVSDPTLASGQPNDFKTLDRVLNAVGYYVEFNNAIANRSSIPSFITNPVASWRYRLMELNQPSQNLAIYSPTVAYENPGAWFSKALDPTQASVPVLVTAENVIALIIRPKAANPVPNATASTPAVVEIAPNYGYDTKAYAIPQNDSISRMSKNQLPPLVQVTLVAIDEPSGARLATQYGTTPPPLVDASLFTDVTKYDTDLNLNLNPNYTTSLCSTLHRMNLNYRVFVEDVSIPSAKWSQTN